MFRKAIGLPLLALLWLGSLPAAAQGIVTIEPPRLDATAAAPVDGLQTAVLAGGCFWGIQAVYQHTKGVTNAVSGYAGGAKEDADYKRVSRGVTQHAEAVQITYDPRVVSYGKLLQIFFSVAHDPTELDRQGPDIGAHYRSEIFPQTDAQRDTAKAYVTQLDAANAFPEKIVTRINASKVTFYPAEAYHQDYAFRNPFQPYIVINDAPKVRNLKRAFADLYREKPVLVADAQKQQASQ